MTWDDAADELLKSMREQGLNYRRIAEAIGCTRNSAIGRGKRIGLAKPKPPSKPKLPKQPKRTKSVMRKVRRHAIMRYGVETEHVTPIDDLAISMEQRKSIFQLRWNTCRWPVGESGRPEFFYCGGQAVDGRPYCAGHLVRAYQPAPARERKAAA